LFFGRQKYKNFVYFCDSKPNNRKSCNNHYDNE